MIFLLIFFASGLIETILSWREVEEIKKSWWQYNNKSSKANTAALKFN